MGRQESPSVGVGRRSAGRKNSKGAERSLAAELAVITSVQDGLASKLDLQSIYELIGEKVREIFNIQVVDIVSYDPAANLIAMPYSYEKGDRSVIAPREPYGFRKQVINSGAPLLINQNFVELAMQSNNPLLTGAWPKSALFVPLVTEGQVRGIISIQDLDHENAFSPSDVQLLQTLANAMSVALENARLFDETQRLLRETERRAREFATVNTVSAALVGELDLNALIELVGEQIRSVFKADIAYVALLDRENGIINFPYQYGQHLEAIPWGQGLTSRIIQSAQPLLINQDMDRRRQTLGVTLIGKRARSFLGVPIFVGGEPVGVVSVQSTREEDWFTENDRHLLSTIAANVGIAFQNARLFDGTQRAFQAEQQAHQQAETLRSVAQALNQSLSLMEVFDLVLTEIQKVIPYDSAGIYQVNEGRRVFVTGRGFGNLEELKGISFEFNQQDDEIGYLISRSLQPLILDDAPKRYPQYFSAGLHAVTRIRSYMAVPILLKQKLIGMITLDREEPGFYNDHHAALAMAFAAQAATAINNARLFDETQHLLEETEKRAAELSILNSVGETMVKTLDVNTMIKLVGDKVLEIFDVDSVEIMLLDQRTNLIHVSYEYDRNEGGYIDYVEPFPLGTGLASRVIRSGAPLMLGTLEEELANGAYFPPEIIEKGLGILSQSWLGVPIVAKAKVLGILALANARPHAFDESQLSLLQTLSSNVGVAIENARLFQEEQQRAAELAIINRVQEGLASKLEMQEIYELVGEKLREVFQNADLSIGLYDPETGILSAPFVVERGERVSFPPVTLNGRGIIGHMLNDPRPLLLDAEDIKRAMREYQSEGVIGGGIPKSALYVPIMMGGSMRGVVVLEDMQHECAFKESDVRLLDTLTDSMSVALENARLWEQEKMYRKALQRELEIGREIQAGFLPDALPQVEGWEIAALLRSAREVAGDFYDVFELPDGNIGLVIADVCDKGVGAALFMTLFRSLIRVTATRETFDYSSNREAPGSAADRLIHAMSQTNNYIAETHGKSGMFATLFFGILDPRNGSLTYVNGGHEPPILLRDGRVRDCLHKTGPAVGAILHGNFLALETKLNPGDLLFAYTDGVTEAKNPQEDFFGHERLRLILEREIGSAYDLVGCVESELRRFIDHAIQFDDITLLAVRRK